MGGCLVAHTHNHYDATNKTDYDKFVILVCNVSNEHHLTQKERVILEAMISQWKKNHNDPNGDKINIIYMNETDKSSNAKFAPLQSITQKSRIYVIGHCKPGSDNICSDPTGKEKKVTAFSYQKIGDTLLDNIVNPDIIRDVDEHLTTEDASFFYPNTAARRLRICVPACFSAASAKGDADFNDSFCHKLAKYLFNHRKENVTNQPAVSRILICDVVGNTSYVIPIPLHANASIFEIASYLSTDKTNPTSSGFHKRHYENVTDIFSKTHQPEINYKVTFALPKDVTIDKMKQIDTTIVVYGTAASKSRLQKQIDTQLLLDQCNEIIFNDHSSKQYDEEITTNAKKTREMICFNQLPTIPTWEILFPILTKMLQIQSKDEVNSQGHQLSD